MRFGGEKLGCHIQSPRKAGRWVEWGPGWEALKGRGKDKGVIRELGSGISQFQNPTLATGMGKFLKEKV